MNAARFASAAPDLALGVAFVLTWLRPRWIGVDVLPYALVSMLLEFIVIHSAAFMGAVSLSSASRPTRTMQIFALGLFYSLFLVGFALAAGRWWVLWAFWSLTLNRLTGVVFGTAPDGEERDAMQSGWAVSVLLYLAAVFATILLPLPRLGVTPDVIADAHLPGTGLWVDHPQKLLAAGAGYFLSQGWVELRGTQWVRDRIKSGTAAANTATD